MLLSKAMQVKPAKQPPASERKKQSYVVSPGLESARVEGKEKQRMLRPFVDA